MSSKKASKKEEAPAVEQMSRKDLIVLAKELNKQLQFDPEINVKQDPKALQQEIVGLIQGGDEGPEITANDPLSKTAFALLHELGLPEGKKEAKKAPPAPVEEEEDAPVPAKVKQPKAEKKDKTKSEASAEQNKFGHRIGSQADQIDKVLEKGGTVEAIAKKTGLTNSRVSSHIKHMKEHKHVKEDGKGGFICR